MLCAADEHFIVATAICKVIMILHVRVKCLICLIAVSLGISGASSDLLQFTPPSTGNDGEEFRNILVSSDRVLVGSSRALYALDIHLLRQQDRLELSGPVSVLVSDPNGTYSGSVLSCGLDECLLVDARDFSNVIWQVQGMEQLLTNSFDKAGIFAPGQSGDSELFFAQSAVLTGPEVGRAMLAKGSLQISSTGEDSFFRLAVREESPSLPFEVVYQFRYNGFVYFIAHLPTLSQTRLIRFCENDTGSDSLPNPSFTSHYEMVLSCVSGDTSDRQTFAASFLQTSPEFAAPTLLLATKLADQVEEVEQLNVCAFSMEEINTLLLREYLNCVSGDGVLGFARDQTVETCSSLSPQQLTEIAQCMLPSGLEVTDPLISSQQTVLQHSLVAGAYTSFVSTALDGNLFLFVGTSEGTVEQFYAANATHSVHLRSIRVPSSMDDLLNTSVLQLAASSNGEFIHALTSNLVLQIPIDNCNDHADCMSCVIDSNPLCGWCVSEGSCSRGSDCQNATTRWIQGNPADILTSIVVAPNLYAVTNLEIVQLQVTPGVPVLLQNESFSCHFTEQTGLFNITVSAEEITHGVEFLCNISEIVLPVGDFDNGVAVLDVTLLVETQLVLPCSTQNSTLTLYHCPAITSCSDCLVTDNVCGWCNVLKVCSSSPATCSNESDFLQVGANESYGDVCPLIGPSSLPGGRYIHPVRIQGSIELAASNLPAPVSPYFYSCAIGDTNLPALYNNRTAITCIVGAGKLEISDDDGSPKSGEIVIDGASGRDVQVLWISPDKFHEIDSDDDIRVILYDCTIVADQCSACIGANINTTFQCGWCVDPSSGSADCQHVTECLSGNNFLTDGRACPDPDIVRIQPVSGPPQGGTAVTITGTNLGVTFSDILAGLVKVNNVLCTPIEEGYVTGTQIVCETGSYSSDGEGVISIILLGELSSLRSTLSAQRFSIVSPSVLNVVPSFGPMAGGSTLVVSGTELNISNIEDTRVTIAVNGTSSVECIVQLDQISSTELVCITSPYGGPTPHTGQLVVHIDNAILNTSAVLFTYLVNPVITALVTPTTIPAGGISLIFFGTNLDVVQQPRLIITIANHTVESLCVIENSTALVCPAPQFTVEFEEAVNLTYTVVMDSAPGPDPSVPELQLSLRPNPSNFTLLTPEFLAGSEGVIVIEGANLDSVPRDEIRVKVGPEPCMPRNSPDPNQYICQPPQFPPGGASQIMVKIFVGSNFEFILEDSLTYITLQEQDLTAAIAVPIVAIVMGFIVVVAVVVLTRFLLAKVRRKNKKLVGLQLQLERMGGVPTVRDNSYAGVSDIVSNPAVAELLTGIPDELLVPSNQLRLLDSIGQGEFGVVYKAHLIKWHGHGEPRLVAVKTLKGLFTPSDVESMVGEILRMQHFDHCNVMSLIGVCLDAGSGAAIVMSYMANGSVLSYLKKERSKMELDDDADIEEILAVRKLLLRMCSQVAAGMEYLAAQKFVHRDLAARNCMIDAHGGIKVADFGLSENVYTSGYYRQDKSDKVRLPFKWMAPESLGDGVFSEMSDVWSFGVTCWEVFSCGHVPYPGVDPFNIFRLIENGHRLEKPTNNACAAEIYSVMRQCWHKAPEDRPSFAKLATTLDRLLQTVAGYMELSMVLPAEDKSDEIVVPNNCK